MTDRLDPTKILVASWTLEERDDYEIDPDDHDFSDGVSDDPPKIAGDYDPNDDTRWADLDMVLSGSEKDISGLLERIDKPDSEVSLAALLGGADGYAAEIRRPPRNEVDMLDPDADAEIPGGMEITSSRLDVDADLAEDVMDSIHRRIEDARSEGWDVTRFVIGTPQYKVLLAWTQAEYGVDPEDYIGLDELIVVPGPQLHPVLPNKEVLWDDL